MAYVPDYEYDLFLSYAWANNHSNWVQQLFKQLMDRLHEKDRSIAPFHDSKFPRNEGLRKGLSDRASKSAILVAVVSEAYFRSDYCKLEREAFLSQSQNGEVNSRASIVSYENIEVKKNVNTLSVRTWLVMSSTN